MKILHNLVVVDIISHVSHRHRPRHSHVTPPIIHQNNSGELYSDHRDGDVNMNGILVNLKDEFSRDTASMVPDKTYRRQGNIVAFDARVVLGPPIGDSDKDIFFGDRLHIPREDEVEMVADEFSPEPAAMQTLNIPTMLLVADAFNRDL